MTGHDACTRAKRRIENDHSRVTVRAIFGSFPGYGSGYVRVISGYPVQSCFRMVSMT